ncbi:DUF4156 domain-containing protein [Aliivibrio logei]|jgi:hypothetical protein|uniref:DUF4156 domain-containing protein n=1 Tax=Aliivibrio logei TaxID=688 RepID=UPI0035C93BA2
MKTLLISTLSLFLLSGCISTTQPLDNDSSSITLHYSENMSRQCSELGTVTGSEGHWYTFFFISNKDLMVSAVNDIKNEAYSLGANTVILQDPMPFNTSITLLGTAYSCP